MKQTCSKQLSDNFFWYGGLLLALYNDYGHVAPRLRLHDFWFHFTWFVFVFWVCSLQLFGTPCAWWEGYSANLVRPGPESNSRPISTETDAPTTRPRAGQLTDKLVTATGKTGLLISSYTALNYEHPQHKRQPVSNQITRHYVYVTRKIVCFDRKQICFFQRKQLYICRRVAAL